MNDTATIPESNFVWRDGKLYYTGPIQTPKVIPATVGVGLSQDELAKLRQELTDNLEDYDFDAVLRSREIGRKLPPEEPSHDPC